MRGFISDPVQTRDPFITKQVTKHLFAEEPPDGLGTDLISLNIQRAREHGLPGEEKPRRTAVFVRDDIVFFGVSL